MKKVYVTPEIHIIAIEPEEILAATGNGWNTEGGPDFGGDTGGEGGGDDDDTPGGSLSKGDIWDDTFLY